MDIEPFIYRYKNILILYKYRPTRKQQDGTNKYYL